MKRFIPVVLSMVFVGTAMAQAPAAGAPAQARPATSPQAQLPDPGRMAATALAVVRAIDAGQAPQLWDSASPVTRNSVKREAFVEGVANARRPLGAVGGREWISISRQRGGQNGLPAGNYVSVELLAGFAGNRVARELVSFRQDEDGVWRFTGYTLR